MGGMDSRGLRGTMAAMLSRLCGLAFFLLAGTTAVPALAGLEPRAIARQLGVSQEVVHLWCDRFCEHRVDGVRAWSGRQTAKLPRNLIRQSPPTQRLIVAASLGVYS